MADPVAPEPNPAPLSLELGEIDLVSGVLCASDGARRLSARALAVLRRLVAASPRPVSRQALLVDALGYHQDSLSRAPDDAIRCLRAKIERDPGQPAHVLTVHGEGYRFVPRRTPQPAAPPMLSTTTRLGDRHLDLEGQRVVFDDGRVEPLTVQETALLSLLLDAGGAAVSREQLLREVWGRREADGARPLVHADAAGRPRAGAPTGAGGDDAGTAGDARGSWRHRQDAAGPRGGAPRRADGAACALLRPGRSEHRGGPAGRAARAVAGGPGPGAARRGPLSPAGERPPLRR